MPAKQTGKIVIISSPSGGGKTSICRRLLQAHADKGWRFSISYTTRPKREGEKNGREYYFVDDKKFTELVKSDFFAEHFKVHLYQYGTPRGPLEEVLKTGGVMLLDVDVQGAKRLKEEYTEAITIFILPPSHDALRQRLKARGTETEEQFTIRLNNAQNEMKLWKDSEYVVINDDLDKAVNEVQSIVIAHHCRTDKCDVEQIERIIG